MSSLSQFGGGTPVGQIVQGQFANNSRYLPCDGNDYVSATYPLLEKTNLITVGANQPISRTLPATQVWTGTVSNGSVMVAVSSTSGTTAASSSDGGITWTSRTIPTGVYQSVAWNGTVFCAVGTSICATSPDGITWTSRTIASGTHSGIAWTSRSGLFVVVTNDSSTATQTSPDGITWTTRSGAFATNDYRQAVRNVNGQFWALPRVDAALGAPYSYSVSDDGLIWNLKALPVSSQPNWSTAVYSNGKYYLGLPGVMYVSVDTYVWTSFPVSIGGFTPFGVFSVGGLIFATPSSSSNILGYSPDGLLWKFLTLPSTQTWGRVESTASGVAVFPLASSSASASIAIDSTKFRTPLARPLSDIDRLYIKVS